MNTVKDEDALVREHLDVATFVANRICLRLPRHVDREEVHAAAMEGLLYAVRTWNPDRGVALRTWCGTKARTAVLDWLREGVNGKSARHPGKQRFLAMRVSLDTSWRDGRESDLPLRATLVGESADSVSRRIDLADLVEWACRGLLPDERAVVTRYYLDGVNLKQIGDELGLSETRMSQLLSETLSLLKGRMEMLTAREETPPRAREEAELRALRELDEAGAKVERADGRISATLHYPPLFCSPVVCHGDDLKDLAGEVRRTIAQRRGLSLPGRSAP